MSVGWFTSDLVFDDLDADLERVLVVASTDVFASDTLTVQIAAGGLVAGELRGDDGIDRAMGPGWLVSGGTTWRLLDGVVGAEPFLLLSLSFGATGTRTRADPPDVAKPLRGDYLGIDARFGAAVGKTFGGVFSPYAAARAFGGPVLWWEDDEHRIGTDRYHVQIAAGAAVLLGPADFFVEGSPLGERGVTGGVGVTY